ncbi:MAG: hypothetical protein ABFC96_02290, partial [Thermoguttaceae bacterium]
MRVAVLHNAVAADAPPEDQDTLVQAEAVSRSLSRLGHQPQLLPCTLDLNELRRELTRLRPDLVFNLVESLADADSLLYLPVALLDAIGLPYVGNTTEALFLTTHKLLGKQYMRQAELPTPDWIESDIRLRPAVTPSAAECVHNGPGAISDRGALREKSWIIKGVWDQGSRGMEDDAVVRNAVSADLLPRLEQRRSETGRPCFAEQFIEGREFNLAVLGGPNGPESLPPAEIDFSAFPSNKPRIVGYRAKWQEDCFEYQNTQRRFDFPASDAELLARLRTLALGCWRLFDLRGWARVDFRVDASGQP